MSTVFRPLADNPNPLRRAPVHFLLPLALACSGDAGGGDDGDVRENPDCGADTCGEHTDTIELADEGETTSSECGLGACGASDLPEDGAGDMAAPHVPMTLAAPVEVYRDEQGTAHVYAESEADLWFAQGHEMARDRAFQMDYLRHFIYGTRASVYGERFFADDVVKRAIGFREISEENFAFYRREFPEVAEALEAFADGVNAQFADMRDGTNGGVRPVEFDRIDPDYQPRPWDAVDSVAIGKALVFNQSFQAEIELGFFAALTLMGEARVRDMVPFTPMFATYILEPSPTPDSELSLGGGTGGEGSIRLDPDYPLVSEDRVALARALTALAELLSDATGRPRYGATGGSNSWAVAGEHSQTGAAILCNDTHMPLTQPSTLYPMHIVNTDFDELGSIGYCAPGAPSTLIGNTASVAWGLTNGFGDVTDLYRETISGDGTQVRLNDEWMPMEILEVEVAVIPEGGAWDAPEMRTATVRRVPHHGPILNDLLPPELGNTLANLNYYFSVRFTGFRTDSREYVAFRALRRAVDIGEQVEALRDFNGGVMNWSLADSSGNIAYLPAGPYPIRARPLEQAPPYLPLSGNGEDEWQGFVAFDEIPRLFEPEKGYFVTANNCIGSGSLDNEPTTTDFYFGHFFDLGTRAWRLTNRLEEMIAADDVSPATMRALQIDTWSAHASVWLPHLLRSRDAVCVAEPEGDRCRALGILAGWDYFQESELAAPSLFSAWAVHLMYETYVDDMVDLIFDLLSRDMENLAGRGISHWLSGRLPPSGTNYWDDRRTRDVVETWEEISLRALDGAIAQLGTFFGESVPMEEWDWGSVHVAVHPHAVWPDLNVGPSPNNSGFRTVNSADFPLIVNGVPAELPYVQNEGSQIRYCVELADGAWRISGGLNGSVTGHSGDSAWADQIPLWLDDQSYDVPFVRADVEAQAVSHYTLPAGFPE